MFRFGQFYRSRRQFSMERGDGLHLLAGLPDASIDTFVSDPPYGIELSLQWTGKKKAIIGEAEARRLWRDFVPQAYRAAKPNTAHVFFGTWKSPWMHDVLAESFQVKGCVVWYKRQWGLGYYLRPRWELAFLCHKGKPPLPAKAEGDVWECARDGRLQHPCQKPVELLRRAVRLVLPGGASGIVCDPFAGIASTGVAALLEGHRFIGREISARYARMGLARLETVARDSRAMRDSQRAFEMGLNDRKSSIERTSR
jgi:site-specific DNA-methyltransferase (adenine-specific)